MAFAAQYPRITRTRRIEDLCGTWEFRFDPERVGERDGWAAHGLPDPIDMPVPASFNDVFTDKASREYYGDFWYAKCVFVPGEWESGNVDIRFDAATHRATVFVNGSEVASHEGGFTPFCAHLNGCVRWNDWNYVAVRVNNELTEHTLPAGGVATLRDGTRIAAPYFDFFNYAGLQRKVRLLSTPERRVAGIKTSVELIKNRAQVRYELDLEDAVGLRAEVVLVDGDGQPVADSQGEQGVLTVEDPRLWGLRRPYLYTLWARLYDGTELVDEWYDTLGLRTIEVSGRNILLNGRPVYLKGFGRHEDSPVHGRGFDPVVNKRDFELLKWMGANSFRTSHYPYSEEQLYEADREGFFVIDEVAAVGMLRSTKNFADAVTAPRGETYFDDPAVREKTLPAHIAAVQELVERDRNHACVCAWSLFNEPDFSSEAAVPYAQKVFDACLDADPQKRPRSYTNVTRCRAGIDKCTHLADFMMLNRYDGWYVCGGPRIEDAKAILIEEMHKWEELEPNKPFLFTEYGTDTMAGVHKLPSVMWSEEYQLEFFRAQHEVFDMFDWVVGEQPWNLCDFQTGEGVMRVDGNKKGAFTRDRQPKAIAFLLRDRWLRKLDYLD
ncbi:beta-glucuronidase [Paratractidigestivibacter sp.]|uniref:beta-glucuronidase n=1 Tax=Paratractidigestivibacter sp. TaxID=2847316 RepID=UPI002ABE21B2|nr:beta-glucuronidase [Paratractidigestivibacter sp.]